MAAIRHKRGDTFEYSGALTKNGLPQDATGWAVTAQLRTKTVPRLVGALTCTWLDAVNGILNVSAAAADTATWPVGTLLLDFQYTLPDLRVISTATLDIEVLDEVTQ
jgi:hypothetical protein